MKITYHKNPLYSTTELDEHEKKELWYKIKIEQMDDLLFSAHFHLEGQYFNLETAKKAVDPDYYIAEDDEISPLDKRCDDLLAYYISELQGVHLGDCTCVACSCGKCHAESLIGIDTIKGLGKHSASKIDGAFGSNNEKTIDEAIASLANYEPSPPSNPEAWEKLGGYEQYIPRWKAEAKQAHDWLVNYKNTYLKENK